MRATAHPQPTVGMLTVYEIVLPSNGNRAFEYMPPENLESHLHEGGRRRHKVMSSSYQRVPLQPVKTPKPHVFVM